MRWWQPILAAGSVALCVSGCASGPGHGFGEIAGVTLDARYAPGVARDLGDGWALTDQGYRVRFDGLEVEGGGLQLEQLPGAGANTSFDPANPPEGFTLCHGGHCHAEDGSLWTYEEIEAELAGGEGAWTPSVAFGLDRALDLLAGEVLVWSECDPSCILPAANIQRVSLPLSVLHLEATIWDDAAGTTEWSLVLQADISGSWAGTLDLPLDRDHDPLVTLDLTANVDGLLLDGLDPAELQPGGGPLPLDATATAALVANLQMTELMGSVHREPF